MRETEFARLLAILQIAAVAMQSAVCMCFSDARHLPVVSDSLAKKCIKFNQLCNQSGSYDESVYISID